MQFFVGGESGLFYYRYSYTFLSMNLTVFIFLFVAANFFVGNVLFNSFFNRQAKKKL